MGNLRHISWFLLIVTLAILLIGGGIASRKKRSQDTQANGERGHVIQTPKQETAITPQLQGSSIQPLAHQADSTPPGSMPQLDHPDSQVAPSESGRSYREEADEERRRIEEEVANETLAETVHNLTAREASELFAHEFAGQQGLAGSVAEIFPAKQCKSLLKDPRAAKLMAIAESGTPAEKAQLLEMIRALAEQTLADGGYIKTTYAQAGSIFPILMAKLDPSMETLQSVVSLYNARMAIFEENPRAVCWNDFPNMLYLAAAEVMDNLSAVDNVELTPPQKEVLSEYARYQTEYRETAIEWAGSEQGHAVLVDEYGEDVVATLAEDALLIEQVAQEYCEDVFQSGERDPISARRQAVIDFARSLVPPQN